jgi:hypothetical protein
VIVFLHFVQLTGLVFARLSCTTVYQSDKGLSRPQLRIADGYVTQDEPRSPRHFQHPEIRVRWILEAGGQHHSDVNVQTHSLPGGVDRLTNVDGGGGGGIPPNKLETWAGEMG